MAKTYVSNVRKFARKNASKRANPQDFIQVSMTVQFSKKDLRQVLSLGDDETIQPAHVVKALETGKMENVAGAVRIEQINRAPKYDLSANA